MQSDDIADSAAFRSIFAPGYSDRTTTVQVLDKKTDLVLHNKVVHRFLKAIRPFVPSRPGGSGARLRTRASVPSGISILLGTASLEGHERGAEREDEARADFDNVFRDDEDERAGFHEREG